MPRDARRLRAERQAHADLAGALAHDVRHHAVDANHAEQQRDAGGDREKHHRERHLRGRAIEGDLQGSTCATASFASTPSMARRTAGNNAGGDVGARTT